MKKSLIALAVLAASGAAMAQSSVTLFGVVDAGVSRLVNSGVRGNTGLSNSGYNSSRLGFRGTEDLGGGLSASFWLEGALGNDDGSGGSNATIGGVTGTSTGGFNFQRRSTVSLAGGFGEIRLGRDYTPTFWNDTVFDPFGTNGVGTNLISSVSGGASGGGLGVTNYVRASNSVGYFLPSNLGGFYGQVMYAFDEADNAAVLGNRDVGRYLGGRVGYSAGPLNVALAGARSNGSDPVAVATPDYNTVSLGASFNFGFMQLTGEVSRVNREAGVGPLDQDIDGFLIGALAPVGPGQVRASIARVKLDTDGADPRATKFALGYVYNLSKRTAVYTTVARVSNKNGSNIAVATNGLSAGSALAGRRSSGYDLGIRHSF